MFRAASVPPKNAVTAPRIGGRDGGTGGDDDATEMSPAPSPGSAASVVTTATVASAVVLTGLHCDDYDQGNNRV